MRTEVSALDAVGRSDKLLQRIAETLGLTRETFVGRDPLPAEFAQGRELLHLWSVLHSETDRERVLRLMRALVSDRADA